MYAEARNWLLNDSNSSADIPGWSLWSSIDLTVSWYIASVADTTSEGGEVCDALGDPSGPNVHKYQQISHLI